MDGGAWQAKVHGVAKESDTTEHEHDTYVDIYIVGKLEYPYQTKSSIQEKLFYSI